MEYHVYLKTNYLSLTIPAFLISLLNIARWSSLKNSNVFLGCFAIAFCFLVFGDGMDDFFLFWQPSFLFRVGVDSSDYFIIFFFDAEVDTEVDDVMENDV